MAGDNAREIVLGDDFGDVVVKANGTTVQIHADGRVDAHQEIAVKGQSANIAASDRAAPQIGDFAPAGDPHQGFIYCGIPSGDHEPLWISQYAPRLMNHLDARAWASVHGGNLPTREQGGYLNAVKDKGALKYLFNRSDSFSGGYFWLAEPGTDGTNDVWSQRFSDGGQGNILARRDELSALCVRR